MATKAPIYLKRGSRKGKKEKLRDLLSSDMISPPLGDFRHTIHVGSGGRGDTFGDISFLQGKFHLLPHGHATEGTAAFEFSRTATVSGGEQATAPSPLLKNAISLPALGGAQALTLPSVPAPNLPSAPAPTLPMAPTPALDPALPSAPDPALPVAPAPPKPPRLHRDEAGGQPEPLLSHAGSLLSLHVDLGPSILEDVLQVMDRHRAERGARA
ncbi:BORG1 protein, partial [Dicaeum eximium]|nr:BORG1 protein [Dicaeum eximium]